MFFHVFLGPHICLLPIQDFYQLFKDLVFVGQSYHLIFATNIPTRKIRHVHLVTGKNATNNMMMNLE